MNANTSSNNVLATRHSDMVLDDPQLSLAAKGLFVAISYLGNKIKLSSLGKYCSDDKQQISFSLNELINSGYIKLNGDELSIKPAATFGLNS